LCLWTSRRRRDFSRANADDVRQGPWRIVPIHGSSRWPRRGIMIGSALDDPVSKPRGTSRCQDRDWGIVAGTRAVIKRAGSYLVPGAPTLLPLQSSHVFPLGNAAFLIFHDTCKMLVSHRWPPCRKKRKHRRSHGKTHPPSRSSSPQIACSQRFQVTTYLLSEVECGPWRLHHEQFLVSRDGVYACNSAVPPHHWFCSVTGLAWRG
jgi:hypothetical protein